MVRFQAIVFFAINLDKSKVLVLGLIQTLFWKERKVKQINAAKNDVIKIFGETDTMTKS